MCTWSDNQALALSSLSVPIQWLVSLGAIVLSGAPLTAHWLGTATLAAYITLLALLPLHHTLGLPPSKEWTRLLSGEGCVTSERVANRSVAPHEWLVLVPTAATVCGAWLAAATLALDWGRSWQAWPLPPVYGALAGLVVGNFAGVAMSLAARARGVARATDGADAPSALSQRTPARDVPHTDTKRRKRRGK